MARSHPSNPDQTLIALLRRRAYEQPDREALVFLGEDATRLTYAQLDQQVRALAVQLLRQANPGDRALLIVQPGAAYIVAFWACLYAGLIPVPAYPPRPNRPMPRLQAIIANAQPQIGLANATLLRSLDRYSQMPELRNLRWQVVDELDDEAADEWQPQQIAADDLALVQYTAGSTGAPKGVMLSHSNLLHNLAQIQRCFGHTPASRGVIWLPPYHDMGLIGGILQPIYVGFPVTLMAPASFLQAPLRWLQAISETRATTSGGPNFAYDLAARTITPDQIATLDLSAWQVAFNGAEPVRAATLDRFAAVFAPCGFRPEAFYPCYGLAEATLIVAGGRPFEPPRVRSVNGPALERHRLIEAVADDADARSLVGVGSSVADQQIRIVDPQTLAECAPDQIGEIWVAGPSIARGYWRNPDETAYTFGARLTGSGDGPFLRTGDLGVIAAGELFVTGRLKDLIIIRGQNYYPQDIELTAEASHPALRPGCGAAFAIDDGSDERLVIVYEVERQQRTVDPEVVAQAIRQAVATQHELIVHAVVLLRPATIPKTSSGKIQRHACREGFLSGTLPALGTSVLESSASASTLDHRRLRDADSSEREQLLLHALRTYSAHRLGLDPEHVDPQQSILQLGLDSLAWIELVHALERDLELSVPIAALIEEQSLIQLAHTLAAMIDHQSEPARPLLQPTAETIVPLSFGQQALWFLQQLSPASSLYTIANAFRINGSLDVAALQRALQGLITRHPALRTLIAADGQTQQIQPTAAPPLSIENAHAWTEATLHQRLNQAAQQPFDLARDLPWRIWLFQRDDDEQVLLLALHHSAADLWSMAVVLRDLSALYAAETSGSSAVLPTSSASYADYVRWQRRLLDSAVGAQAWRYWQQQLAGELPALNLPTDRPRPTQLSGAGATCTQRLPLALTTALHALSARHDVTLFMTLLTAWQLLLARYTGQTELIIGAPTTGRTAPELTNTVGYIVNPVLLRADLTGDPSFATLLQRTRRTVLEALAHQDLPFALLAEYLQPRADAARPPLIQAMFALQSAPSFGQPNLASFALATTDAQLNLGSLPLSAVALDRPVTQFDLDLVIAELPSGLGLSMQYSTELFDAPTIERMLAHYAELLQTIVTAEARLIEQPAARLPLLTDADRQQLHDWNATAAPYPADRTLHQLFGEQARRTPDAPAIAADQPLSYAELDRRSNQLAHYLRSVGVTVEQPVALVLTRSPLIAVAILGVLKAGGCYMPLDASYPQERIQLMLADASARVVLTEAALLALLPNAAMTVQLDTDWPTIERQPTTPPETITTPEQLAYVIYTSGSTGTPKGIMSTHRGAVNFAAWCQRTYQIGPRDRVSHIARLAFDASVAEIWPALISGACVQIADEETRLTPTRLLRWLMEQTITLVPYMPPVLVEQMLSHEWPAETPLRAVITGSDRVQSYPPEALPFALINTYGPTETTVWVTDIPLPTTAVVAQQTPGMLPPIGRPIQNAQPHVLDQHGQLQPVPIGVAGELYIGGAGLARGYLGQSALTAQAFVPDPWSTQPGARLYKTGDLVRFRADGNLEFLGRLDQQVKLRGYRIELGEIEALLRQHAAVREVAVLARDVVATDGSAQKRLLAYVVPQPDASQDNMIVAEVLGWLKTHLPDYMLPTIMLLDALPLTANAKLDRAALPLPAEHTSSLSSIFVAPRTDIERVLAQIWSEVLAREPIGVHDSFFELGGHSLLVTQVLSRVTETFGVAIPLRDLFEAPTIAELAALLPRYESIAGRSAAIARVQLKLATLAPEAQRALLDQQRAKFRMPEA